MITLFIPGEVAPQGSKRHVGGGRMIEASKKWPAWRKAVEQAAAEAWGHREPIDAPVKVTARFYLPRPKRPRFPVPATGLDADKIQRSLGDGLERGGLLRNDARIVHWDASKHYATDTQPEGVHVTITELKGTES